MDGYYLQTHRITCVNRISGVEWSQDQERSKNRIMWMEDRKARKQCVPCQQTIVESFPFFSDSIFFCCLHCLSCLFVRHFRFSFYRFPWNIHSISMEWHFNTYAQTTHSHSLVSFDCSVFRFASSLLRFHLGSEIDMICFSFIFPDVYTYHSHDCMQAS